MMGIGLMELVILAVIGTVCLAVPIAIVVAVVMVTSRSRDDRDR